MMNFIFGFFLSECKGIKFRKKKEVPTKIFRTILVPMAGNLPGNRYFCSGYAPQDDLRGFVRNPTREQLHSQTNIAKTHDHGNQKPYPHHQSQ